MKLYIRKFFYFFGWLSLSMIFIHALGSYTKNGILDGLWLSEFSFKSIESFLFDFAIFIISCLGFVYLDTQRTKSKSDKNKPSKLRDYFITFITYFGVFSFFLIFINSLLSYLITGNLEGIGGSLRNFFAVNTFLINFLILIILANVGTIIEIWNKNKNDQ